MHLLWPLICLAFGWVNSAKILCIFPTPIYSHQSVFKPIWRELALRDHEVTVLTTHPDPALNMSNLRQIDLSFTRKLVFQDLNMDHVIHNEKNLLFLMKYVFDVITNMTIEQMANEEVRKLSGGEFDVLLVEAHIPAWFGFARKFNCPIIAATSMDVQTYLQTALGNVQHPILNHSINLPFGRTLNIFQRVVAALFWILDHAYINYILFPSQQRIAREFFSDPGIDLQEIQRNISLVIANVVPGFTRPRLRIPAVIEVHGLHIQGQKALDSEIASFLEKSKNGAIYMSLGSTITASAFTPQVMKIFCEVFSEIPYNTIWKYNGKLDCLNEHILTLEWAPQYSILKHKNLKLFISQGGLQSTEEAIYSGVPVLGLPILGDQYFNVKSLVDLGMGLELNIEQLTRNDLKSAITELISNNTYRKNMEEIQYLIKNEPISPLNKTVWWIEYVLRHKGAAALRSPLIDIPFYKYILIDIIFLPLLVLVALYLAIGPIYMFYKKRSKPKLT